ncbi:MAG TPA: 6-carboxytetrahydropterin synthase, partial [Nitrososphaerales archaeon]|nr:6-carboxytetrahydropterin synthase [Nitrososphaerales archaeon]
MSEELLMSLAPRLKLLEEGAYERAYRTSSGNLSTSTHQLVADLLESLGIGFRERVRVPGMEDFVADFQVKDTFVFVEPRFEVRRLAELRKSKKKVVIIRRDALRSDRFDHGVRVLGLGEEGGLQTIFLDDPSFNFDYAHILPKTEKCSVMHGHTTSVLVEVIGRPIDGMVVDFAVAKQAVREAVKALDHKLFINAKYVTAMDPRSVSLKFETVHGEFAIKAPRQTTVLMDGEATVENLAREALGRIAPRMPKNVSAVGVYA